ELSLTSASMGLEGKTDMSVQATVHRPATDEQRRISMNPSRVSDRVADRTNTAPFLGRYRVRLEPARVAGVVLAVCVLGVAPGASRGRGSLFTAVRSLGRAGRGGGGAPDTAGEGAGGEDGRGIRPRPGNGGGGKVGREGNLHRGGGGGVPRGRGEEG